MSFASTLPAAILDTILARLATLFLSGSSGDLSAAREAARQMLVAYHPETEDELRLAASIVSFSFHALEALGQAADPLMSLNQKLRLRGSAVSLSRESHKAQRRLDQLQKARRAGAQPRSQPAQTQPGQSQPAQTQLQAETAPDLIQTSRAAVTTTKTTGQTWTQAYQQRQRDKRMANRLNKNPARQAQQAVSAAIHAA